MNTLITAAKLHGYRFGIHTSYTSKKSYIGNATIVENGEHVNLLVIPVEIASKIIGGIEKELEWYRTDYCQWAKRKTKQ